MISHRTPVIALYVLSLLVPCLPARAQETADVGGAGGGGEEVEVEVEGSLDLDYSDAENTVLDYEEYAAQESSLQVSAPVKAKGIGVIHEAAKAQASISLSGEAEAMAPMVPEYYVIRKGDTLFYLSEYFFGDPALWPGIWALNPEITNPNWIYPGQALLLAPEEEGEEGEAPVVPTKMLPYEFWKEGTVYYRPLGFVDKDIEEETGKIIGAFAETKYLDRFHKVYIKYKKGKAPAAGSTATVYEVEKTVNDQEKRKIKYGKLVRILGTVKIVGVDKDHRLAKGIITEAARPIERSDLIGPVKWKFEKTEPVKGKLDLEGKIIAPLEDVKHSGQHDIVFINLGTKDGLVEGNRLAIKRKRDLYMAGLGKKDKSKHFPWESIGRVIVIEALKKTATCLVLESVIDIEVGDKVELKRGE